MSDQMTDFVSSPKNLHRNLNWAILAYVHDHLSGRDLLPWDPQAPVFQRAVEQIGKADSGLIVSEMIREIDLSNDDFEIDYALHHVASMLELLHEQLQPETGLCRVRRPRSCTCGTCWGGTDG